MGIDAAPSVSSRTTLRAERDKGSKFYLEKKHPVGSNTLYECPISSQTVNV